MQYLKKIMNYKCVKKHNNNKKKHGMFKCWSVVITWVLGSMVLVEALAKKTFIARCSLCKKKEALICTGNKTILSN